MSIISKLWEKLAEKGKIASLLGFLMAFPVNTVFIMMFFTSKEFTEAQLKAALIVNSIAMVWFILPSKIEISGKIFNLKLED